MAPPRNSTSGATPGTSLNSSLGNLTLSDAPNATINSSSTNSSTLFSSSANNNGGDFFGSSANNNGGGFFGSSANNNNNRPSLFRGIRSPSDNNGTGGYHIFRAVTERDPDAANSSVHYETITYTYDSHLSTLSLEELRLADYAQGRKLIGTKSTTSGFLEEKQRTETEQLLRLLKGPGIEVVVGSKTDTVGQQELWCLPENLISHCSAFLKAACSLPLKEKEENRIVLADEDPRIFSLFVEWMYYGRYTHRFGTPVKADIKAWVLGDKFMSIPFKNYAMKRVYNAHTGLSFGVPFTQPVLTEDFAYVCDNTVEGAKLRQFYIDFVVANFSEPFKVAGNIKKWESVMMDYDDARAALFTAMRSGNQPDRSLWKIAYIEEEVPVGRKN